MVGIVYSVSLTKTSNDLIVLTTVQWDIFTQCPIQGLTEVGYFYSVSQPKDYYCDIVDKMLLKEGDKIVRIVISDKR